MIEIVTSATTTTLVITGELDLAERVQFPEITARVVGLRRQLLVIDMCRVTFMDSTGAAFLISLADSGRKRGGATVLRGADARELFVLEVCGALDLFRIDKNHACQGAAAPTGFPHAAPDPAPATAPTAAVTEPVAGLSATPDPGVSAEPAAEPSALPQRPRPRTGD